MKKKNLKLIITMFLVVFLVGFVFINNSYAALTWEALKDDTEGISTIANDTTKVNKIIAIIVSLIRYAGAGIAVIAVMIMGIKYMISSSQDKAEYKKKLIPMGIGAVLLFSASELIGIVGDIALSL